MGSGILMKVLCCGRKSFDSSREVAEGHVRVYVGRDLGTKFEMEANYLNHPLFGSLLRTYSEEEFEYSYEGALRIPCEVGLFKYLVRLLETSDPSAHYMELSDLVSRYRTAKQGRGLLSPSRC